MLDHLRLVVTAYALTGIGWTLPIWMRAILRLEMDNPGLAFRVGCFQPITWFVFFAPVPLVETWHYGGDRDTFAQVGLTGVLIGFVVSLLWIPHWERRYLYPLPWPYDWNDDFRFPNKDGGYTFKL